VSLRVVAHPDAAAFLERAEPWLFQREAEHNLVLGIAMAESSSDQPNMHAFFATVERDADIVGVSFRTPPHKLSVSRMPLEAVPLLVEEVSRRYESIPAVLGPKEVAEAAAEEWTRLRGGQWQEGMRQGLYRLDTVVPPPPTPGSVRPPRPEEADLMIEWIAGFARDAGAQFAVPAHEVRAWVAREGFFMWDHEGPVSIARAGGATPGGMRVGFVYTPPELRGQGYATALVATVSQIVLDRGYEFCVLYTDLSNPTSNRIYQKIGYEHVMDFVDADIVGPEG
jgi:RimJ/RimL family protein N-acetyltransferase